MADLKSSLSTFAAGTNDTATLVQDDIDDAEAANWNGVASAAVGIQQVIGGASDLKGTKFNLAERLAVRIQPDGSINNVTDLLTANFGEKLVGAGSAKVITVPMFRRLVFTSNGSFVCPAGVAMVYVECYGSGGGGGGGGNGGATVGVDPGGAGGNGSRGTPGGYASGIFNVVVGSSYPIVVGAGGTAGTSGGGSGGAGNTSSFAGSTCSAGGGTAGVGGGNGTAGSGSGTPGTAGASRSSETSAVGVGIDGDLLVDGQGATGGRAGTGGATGVSGTAGQAGQAGKVVVWY